jgi:hypothetical protein
MTEKMQFLKKEDIPGFLPIVRKRETTLRAMLLQLQIGEGVFLPKEKWKNKSSPAFIVAYLKKTKGLKFEYGFKTDGTGWLFRRVG